MSEHLYSERRRWSMKHYLAGGICLLSVGLTFEQLDGHFPQYLKVFAAPVQAPETNRCAKVVQSSATLSREILGQLLKVPEGKSRAQIRAIVPAPYCELPPITLRVGETTEREAYPLAFKPDTWLVVTYEGNSYAGFDFLLH